MPWVREVDDQTEVVGQQHGTGVEGKPVTTAYPDPRRKCVYNDEVADVANGLGRNLEGLSGLWILPVRAFRVTALKEPKPIKVTFSPLLSAAVVASMNPLRAFSACVLVIPAASAIFTASSALVIVLSFRAL